MKNKWIVLALALCMVFAMTGCGATPATDTQAPVQEELTETLPPKEPLTALTATVRVQNNEEITPFVMTVASMQPADYSVTKTVDGVLTTYTLRYEGSQELEGTLVTETKDGTTEETVSLFLAPYYYLFPDETGWYLDEEAYTTALVELGLGPVYAQKQLQTLYGVYALGYVDALGENHVLDLWLDEQTVLQIELQQLLQGGMMLQ